MATIYVKTKAGRKLFYEGKPIPLDTFIPVQDSPFIRRFIDYWGDLEEQGGTQKAKAAKPAPKPAAPTYSKDN